MWCQRTTVNNNHRPHHATQQRCSGDCQSFQTTLWTGKVGRAAQKPAQLSKPRETATHPQIPERMPVVIAIERSMFMPRIIAENAKLNEIEHTFYATANYRLQL